MNPELAKYIVLAAASLILLITVILILGIALNNWKSYSRVKRLLLILLVLVLAFCWVLCAIGIVRVENTFHVIGEKKWILVAIDVLVAIIILKDR